MKRLGIPKHCSVMPTWRGELWMERCLPAEAVPLLLQPPSSLRLPQRVAPRRHRSLPSRRQQIDETVAGAPPLPPSHGPHRAGHGDVGRPLSVGLVQLAHEALLLRGLGHALHVRVQRRQRLV